MWQQAIRRSSPASDADHSHGGGYLASAADLVIGLLFIFIILVVVLAIRDQGQRLQLEEQGRRALEQLQLKQATITSQQRQIENQRQELTGAGDPLVFVTRQLGDGLKSLLPNIRLDPTTGVISLPEQVLFPRGSAELNPAGVNALARASEFLAIAMTCFVENQQADRDCSQNAKAYRIETIFIEGHTDNVPFAAGPIDNFVLALARARAVERALVANTPLSTFRNRANQPLFSFSAYADMRPISGTDPSDAQNRRVDLRIVLSYRPIEELVPALRLPPNSVLGTQ
jgi:flagellar motor protein MotB